MPDKHQLTSGGRYLGTHVSSHTVLRFDDSQGCSAAHEHPIVDLTSLREMSAEKTVDCDSQDRFDEVSGAQTDGRLL